MARKPPCYGPFGGVGDLNGNGEIDIGDMVMMNNAAVGDIILSPDEAKRADLNGNGMPADIGDVVLLNNYLVGDIDTFQVCSLPGYTPDPQNMETRTVSLTEGQHTIQVSFTGYDTLNATINVSSTGVTCIVGPCNTQGPPGVTTSGWTVTTYLKSATTTTGYAAWLSSKGGLTNVTLSDIFELKDAFIGLTNIGFTPTLPQIMECKDAFIGL